VQKSAKPVAQLQVPSCGVSTTFSLLDRPFAVKFLQKRRSFQGRGLDIPDQSTPKYLYFPAWQDEQAYSLAQP
jgi:hypothetical protein